MKDTTPSFFECGPELRSVRTLRPDEAEAGPDPHEAPALRGIGRPACWSAPTPPESLLSGIYAAAAARALGVLTRRPVDQPPRGRSS
ncbi:MAG: hypothetical protein DYH08_05415 [Actinobacteria bacterium ATB1]|nr:hypothetical protein [Actinobacteria bacterium ATB1]